jgi:hypothetical protein
LIQLLVSKTHKSSFCICIFNRIEEHDDFLGVWSTSHDDYFEPNSRSSNTRSHSGGNNIGGGGVEGRNSGNENQGRTSKFVLSVLISTHLVSIFYSLLNIYFL